MRCEARALCEELINIGERSHVYVPSKEAVDSSLGTEGRGFAICVSVFDCCRFVERKAIVYKSFHFHLKMATVLLVPC